MHVKAFGLMTRHPVKVDAIPQDLRDARSTTAAASSGRQGAPRRDLPPLLRAPSSRCGRAASSAGSCSVPVLRRPPADLVRVHRMGAGATARGRAADRVPPLELARRREPREGLSCLESPRPHLRDRRRPEGGREEPRPDRGRRGRHRRRMCASTVATPRPGTSARGAAERFDHLYSREELAEWSSRSRALVRRGERQMSTTPRSPTPPGSRRAARRHRPG